MPNTKMFKLLMPSIMLIGSLGVAQAQNPAITVGTDSAPVGGTATVPLTFDNGTPTLAGFGFQISYDSTVLTPVTGATGNPADTIVDANDVANCLNNLPMDHQTVNSTCQVTTPGQIFVSVNPNFGAILPALPANVSFGEISFDVAGGAALNTYDLTISNVSGTNAADGTNVTTIDANNGSITVVADACTLSVTSPATLPLTFNLASLTEPQDVVFTNTSATAACTSPTVSITGGAYTQTNTCTTDIAAGGTCTVSVSNNGSVEGDTGTVTLATAEDTAEAAIETVNTVVSVCTLSANPASVTFDLDNLVDPQSVDITNTGTAACTSPMVSITGASYAETNTCTTDLAAGGGTCTVSISNGGSVDGDSGTLTVATTEATVEVPVNTTMGVVEPSISVSSNSLVLAMTNDTGTITVTNTGSDLTDFTFSLADTTNFTIDPNTTNCTATLLAGGTCDIGVIYTGTTPANTALNLGGAAGAVNVVVNVIGGQAPIAIPTISQWSMMIVASLLAMVAAFGFRRKQS